eukprot:2805566-Amphidinium_carterae.2
MAEARTVAGGKRADECRDLRLMLWRCVQVAGPCLVLHLLVSTLKLAELHTLNSRAPQNNPKACCQLCTAHCRMLHAHGIYSAPLANAANGCH